MTEQRITTLKVRNIDRAGKLIKGHQYVSGLIIGEGEQSLTIEVTTHDDWHGTSSTRAVEIAKRRIMSRSH